MSNNAARKGSTWIPTALVLVLGLILLYYVRNLEHTKQERAQQLLLRDTLYYAGKISRIVPLSGNGGVYFLHLDTANVARYDVRDSLRYFYAVVEENKAVLVGAHRPEMVEGDSLVLDARWRSVQIYRNGERQLGYPLYVYSSDPFFQEVNTVLVQAGFGGYPTE